MAKEYILLTGATGFVGLCLARRLLSQKNCNVVAIARPNKKEIIEELRQLGAKVWEGNFYEEGLAAAVMAQYPISHVIHLAAIRGAGLARPKEYHKVNVTGTELLLNTALSQRVRRFIFCSTVGVYGIIPKEVPAGLTTPLNGDTAYHKSKVRAEERVKEFIAKGLDACIIRPTIVYGKDGNGFPQALIGLVKRRLLPLPWRANRIHLLNIDGFNEAVETLLTQELDQNRIFIAADASSVLLTELVDRIHLHYHGREYPVYLKLPNIFFSAIDILSRIMKNEKWTVRARLISKDWFYDTLGSATLLGQKQRETLDEFMKMLSTSDARLVVQDSDQ